MSQTPKKTTQYDKAVQLFNQNKINDSMLLLQDLLQNEPNHEKASFLLGVCYFRGGNLEASEALFRKTIALNNRNDKAHYYLGLVLERRNKIEDSQVEFQTALLINPNFSEVKTKINQNPSSTKLEPFQLTAMNSTEQNPMSTGELLYRLNRTLSSFRILIFFSAVFILFDIIIILIRFDTCLIQDECSATSYGNFAGFSMGFIILGLIGLKLGSLKTRTQYLIYQNRIDIKSGVFRRKEISLMIYEITNASITKMIFLPAVIRLDTINKRAYFIRGVGDFTLMSRLKDEIRDRANKLITEVGVAQVTSKK